VGIYLRATPDQLDAVRQVVPRTANPQHPDEVSVSRPSEALAARLAAKTTFTSLFLGLGLVALLVGGIGIANVMVISVLERRSEIGLRRALGAKKEHIAVQFLTESFLLATLGGGLGITLGAGVTGAYASSRGWPVAVPATVVAGAIGAAIFIGVIAGFYPAARAARIAPSDALRSV
jgi:putative ABC transport system permease protein